MSGRASRACHGGTPWRCRLHWKEPRAHALENGEVRICRLGGHDGVMQRNEKLPMLEHLARDDDWSRRGQWVDENVHQQNLR